MTESRAVWWAATISMGSLRPSSKLARDPLARSAWGEAGRRRIEEFFSLDRMIDSYMRICHL